MLKNSQIRIVLIFFLIEVIVITLLYGIEISYLRNIESEALAIGTAQQIIDNIGTKITSLRGIFFSIIIGSAFITSVAIAYISKKVVVPIKLLIADAGRIAAGEDVEIKNPNPGKKNNEVSNLSNAFNVMITELKANLNELSKQKKQIETILNHMTDGIIVFNTKGNIMLINPAATRLLRILPEDENFEMIFEKHNVDVNLEKVMYLENLMMYEQRVRIGDTHVNILFESFKDENEKLAGVLVLIQDITEHVKLDEMRKEFIADVSHELKTPITSIMGYADTLLEGEYDTEIKNKFLNVIATEARRMAKLVSDLLDLSRSDSGQVVVEKTEFDLGQMVKECQEKLQIEIDKKGHKVECFVTANVPLVYADKTDIERVVLNILSNSIKYTNEGGTINMYVGFVYNDAYIKIKDNGLGIPESDLNKIFERFYRVDKARTRAMGGTGLGLSIAKEILDRNNGSIDIKSEVGTGTEVVIRIPTKAEKNLKNSQE